MKNNLRLFFSILLLIPLFKTNESFAQLAGTEAFLKGDFVEVGIATNGAFGTDNNAPAGYHPRGGPGLALGFVADPDKDGWTVGIPNYIGDYFLPGSPQEGWDMQVGANWAKAWRGVSGTSMTGGLAGSVTQYSSTGGVVEATWSGTLGDLKIKAVTKLKKDKLFFTTTVTIVNTGTATMYDFYYDRTVDPDNEAATPGLGDFATINTIDFAIPSPKNKTLISAIGTSAIKAYLGLASRDCRAKPYILIGGLQPTDSLKTLYGGNGATNAIFKKDSTYRSDVGIGIVFKIDSLKAGDSTQLSYAYVLSAADVDSAFEDLKPKLNVNGKLQISGDTIKACNGTEVKINILGGDYYEWHWSPNIGLSDTVGSRINITAGATAITYTATAVSLLCPIDPITIRIDPIANPDKPKVVTPIYYCQYEVAVPLTATASAGSELNYYNSATGGPALKTLTPVTTAAGSVFYYVSQTSVGLCESERERIEVFIRKIPVLSSFTTTNPTFCAAKDGTIKFFTDSANATYTISYDKNGKPAAPFTFTTDASNAYTMTGLGGGTYTNFVVVNSYGCKSAAFNGPVELIDPAPQTPPISNNGPVCLGEEVTFRGPFVVGAKYMWTGPDGFTSSEQNPSFTVTENAAGVYSLRLQVDSCIYKPATTILNITPAPNHQLFSSTYPICEYKDLLVNITQESGVTYVWSGKDVSLINQGLSIPAIQIPQSGRYILTATSDNGCTTVDSLNVTVDKHLSFIMPADTAVCSVDSALLTVVSDAQSIVWTPGSGLNDSTSFQVKAKPAGTTIYTASAKSGTSCPDTSGKVQVKVVPTPSVSGYDTLVRMNIPYTIMPSYGADVVKWKWIPADSLSCSDCATPTINSNREMSYVVYGTNQEGCTGSGKVTVRVFCDGANITMPNAFTPNNDGTNDIFYVRGTGFTVKSFSIYNRLGQKVFSRENFNPNDRQYGWDGTFGGQAVSDAGGYVYMLEAICFNSSNEPILIKGTVLMIK